LEIEDLIMLAIRLSPETEARLEALAKRTGRTKSYFAREAINEHIGDLEALYIAEERYSDILEGKSDTVPLEEVMKRYGLDG
jgi:RHH-type transcriptional regulator, rel operon repressor / antitoxin RelB